MRLQTQVDILPLKNKISKEDKILFLGSCFANEIGAKLVECGVDAIINPFGVLYNPASIVQSIDRLANSLPFTEEDVVVSAGFYTSFWHHSRFSKTTSESFLECANLALIEGAKRFSDSQVCVITLGTAWVYRHIERGCIVSNCHKIHPAQFERERLSVSDVVAMLERVVTTHPDKRWLFTVSPIRHLKDGAHQNQLSKATLLLAIEEICAKFDNVCYFPAYEVVMDELRDYRFYCEDMTHPTAQTVNYIFEKFLEYGFSPSDREAMLLEQEKARQSRHIQIIER